MQIAHLRQVVSQRAKAAENIAAGVGEFERDLARALASGGRLASILPMARLDADISPVVGHDVISHILGSLDLLGQAMGKTVEGHNGLAALARQFRVPVTAGGDKAEIPAPNEGIDDQAKRAALVAS